MIVARGLNLAGPSRGPYHVFKYSIHNANNIATIIIQITPSGVISVSISFHPEFGYRPVAFSCIQSGSQALQQPFL